MEEMGSQGMLYKLQPDLLSVVIFCGFAFKQQLACDCGATRNT